MNLMSTLCISATYWRTCARLVIYLSVGALCAALCHVRVVLVFGSLDAEYGTVSASAHPVMWTTDERNAICHCEGAVPWAAPPPASRRQASALLML